MRAARAERPVRSIVVEVMDCLRMGVAGTPSREECLRRLAEVARDAADKVGGENGIATTGYM